MTTERAQTTPSADVSSLIETGQPFGIGDEVAVIPDCGDWASDWRDVRLWIGAVHALPGGGFEYWVSDTWPLPDGPALTDGFYMGRTDEPDTLSLVARAAIDTEAAIVLKRYREALEAIQNACNYGVNSPDEALNHVDGIASAALKAGA
jgi:hypothetical protein